MKKLILIMMSLAFCFESMAAGGYGAAGCGLGTMVFPPDRNEWWEQTLAATTNAILGNQTFGITFGSLNCDANALVTSREKTTVFVAANKNSVINELAAGSGETVTVLAELMNCSDKVEFGQTMKSNYNNIVTSADVNAEQIAVNMSAVAKNNNICTPNAG